ncbi:MAG: glycosyltransferase family 2 protein [Nitrospinota bacterium]
MPRPALSVTVVTYNEEARLRRSLESVAWAEELIVVDAQSSDGTVAIAREYTGRVVVRPWPGYAAQKNFALELATAPWVLSLDADEVVSDALRAEIEDVLARGPDCAGYYLPRKNIFLGRWLRHGNHWPDRQLRLFRKGRGRFVDRSVHESVEVEGRTGHLREPLEHRSYDSVGEFFARSHRYAILAAEDLHRRGVRPKPHHQLLRPLGRFLKSYILQRGFLDGQEGLITAVGYGYYVFMRQAHLWERYRDGRPPDPPH